MFADDELIDLGSQVYRERITNSYLESINPYRIISLIIELYLYIKFHLNIRYNLIIYYYLRYNSISYRNNLKL